MRRLLFYLIPPSSLGDCRRDALITVVTSSPSIILGPTGIGKSSTVVEFAKTLLFNDQHQYGRKKIVSSKSISSIPIVIECRHVAETSAALDQTAFLHQGRPFSDASNVRNGRLNTKQGKGCKFCLPLGFLSHLSIGTSVVVVDHFDIVHCLSHLENSTANYLPFQLISLI